MAAFLVGWTKDPAYVAGLDLVTFNALCEAALVLEARRKLEEGWAAWAAAQTTHKGMKEWAKPYEKEAGLLRPAGEGKKFASDLGKIGAAPKR